MCIEKSMYSGKLKKQNIKGKYHHIKLIFPSTVVSPLQSKWPKQGMAGQGQNVVCNVSICSVRLLLVGLRTRFVVLSTKIASAKLI